MTRKLKRLLCFVVAAAMCALFAIGLTGCSQGGSSSNSSQAASNAETISITFQIDGSRAGDQDTASLESCTLDLSQGATVYDALVASGVAIGGDSNYVSSINGLAEKQLGSMSGWMYAVDGEFPQESCGSYALEGGENVVWYYTCDIGNDL